MDLAALIQQYGYAAVFVGSVLEGETMLVLAGLAAHRGYLSLQWVMAVAVAGAFLGDLICFLTGRFLGAACWHAGRGSSRRLRAPTRCSRATAPWS